jgi:hypothetical protein
MWSILIKYILDHAPFFGILVISVLIAICVTIWVARKYYKTIGRIKKTEEQCAECKADVFPSLNSHFDKIDTSLYGISSSILALTMYLKTKDDKLDVSLLISRSPIQLSDFGTKILNDIGGKSVVDGNLNLLLSEMDTQKFKSGLDAHNYAINLIMIMFNNDIFTPIKNYLYNNPVYKYKTEKDENIEYPLDVNDVYTVIGIYLRNKYFEEHPDLVKNWEAVTS